MSNNRPPLLITVTRVEWVPAEVRVQLSEHYTVSVLEVRQRKDRKQFPGKTTLLMDEICFAARLARYRRRLPSDATILSFGGQYAILLLARLRRREPGRIYLANFYLHTLGECQVVRRILRWLMTPNVTILSQSAADTRYFQGLVPHHPLEVIPYCQGEQASDGIPATRAAYVFAGGWTNRDYKVLFECALLLPDTPFVVVMSSRSPAIHPPPNVEVLKDLPPGKFNGYLEASKVVVVPLAEDTGSSGQMVALTAMPFARPLIVTKLPAVMEYLEDGVSGLFYEPGDVESLRLALLKALTSPEAALAMGQQARIRYLTRFTQATYADHILSCLQAPARS